MASSDAPDAAIAVAAPIPVGRSAPGLSGRTLRTRLMRPSRATEEACAQALPWYGPSSHRQPRTIWGKRSRQRRQAIPSGRDLLMFALGSQTELKPPSSMLISVQCLDGKNWRPGCHHRTYRTPAWESEKLYGTKCVGRTKLEPSLPPRGHLIGKSESLYIFMVFGFNWKKWKAIAADGSK
ncbi:uncharacterized protein LOC119270725 isoform X2 [Triticum dicoccoides]|uniref:uncharacterized protein LOC119270725 isoform X2 n=2 Tax=Triticum dicoccoides TaxID=85692 RepID=UPI00188E4838|nr:uncharacterized protein LOC119270725 isoform X2 [Triticum dicoccoides]